MALPKLISIIANVAKNILHVENIPLLGEVIEEKKSKDGGVGQFQQVNLIRLIRKVVRIAFIILATYFIIKGDDEKADKIEKQLKKIEYRI